MALTDIATIEDYLGSTLDSQETIVYQMVIDAVDAFISCQCHTDFDDGNRIEQVEITDQQFVTKDNVQYIYTANTGIGSLIEITGTSNTQSVEVGSGTLSLFSLFTKTDIDFSLITLSALVTLIDAETGWSASLTTGVDDTYAGILYDGKYALDDDYVATICGAENKSNVGAVTNRIFSSDITCGDGMILYRGGYATVPADLQDAATRMTIQAYEDRNPASGVSGELKEEKVGDYSYKKFTTSELNASLATISINYKEVLKCYCSYDI